MITKPYRSITKIEKEQLKLKEQELKEYSNKVDAIITYFNNPTNYEKKINKCIKVIEFFNKVDDFMYNNKLTEAQIKKEIDKTYNSLYGKHRRK